MNMVHPTLSRRVICEPLTRNDHARDAAFFFLAGTQCNEITKLLLHAFDRGFGFLAEPKALLARLYDVQCFRQPP